MRILISRLNPTLEYMQITRKKTSLSADLDLEIDSPPPPCRTRVLTFRNMKAGLSEQAILPADQKRKRQPTLFYRCDK